MHGRQLAYPSLILAAGAIVVPVFVLVGTLVAFYLMGLVVLAGLCANPILQRRLHKVLCVTRCGTCGRSLDAGAVQRAREWSRHAARAECAGRIRIVDAICGHCGAWYVFEFRHNKFVAINRPPGLHVSVRYDLAVSEMAVKPQSNSRPDDSSPVLSYAVPGKRNRLLEGVVRLVCSLPFWAMAAFLWFDGSGRDLYWWLAFLTAVIGIALMLAMPGVTVRKR